MAYVVRRALHKELGISLMSVLAVSVVFSLVWTEQAADRAQGFPHHSRASDRRSHILVMTGTEIWY